ncbi:hypothetical protein [Microbispora sp. NBC_01389]|uniref:hypothetical protein n=1 Tax=Microbispora sp. NBC_01389 TaxID=2903584 RepID=UPI003249DD3C
MSTQLADRAVVRDALQSLATALEVRGFAARLRSGEGSSLHLFVMNPEAPVLTEHVMIAPDAEGEWSFWFSWPERIALVTNVTEAADRIERVLAEVDR